MRREISYRTMKGNARILDWIGLDWILKARGRHLSMLSMELDVIRFVIWKDHTGLCVRMHGIFYGNNRSLIEKPK